MWKGSSYSDFQGAQEPEIDYEDDTNENKVMLKELVLETLIKKQEKNIIIYQISKLIL